MKIGVIGTGTVGEGLLKLLYLEEKKILDLLGNDIEVVRICDKREKTFDYDSYDFTDNYLNIVEDRDIDIVIELIGGVGAAYDIAKRTLTLGKDLVTANKHLLAAHGKELFELARKNNAKLLFEAAVGGGIPVVAPMQDSLFPNRFKKIRGILNGTCNYMLSKMEDGMTYNEALKDAQERGYAEADPTFDVKGIDTGHKISILAYLAWGEVVDFESVGIEGIDGLRQENIETAKKGGKRYKLLGEASVLNGKLEIKVSPQLVDKGELLYEVGGVYNAVEIEGSYTGKTVLYGEGAGMEATANAVLSDICKIIKERSFRSNLGKVDEFVCISEGKTS